jgi:glutamyl-tRNA reductase
VSVIVVGLEQGQCPLDLLERVAVTESALPKALGRLRDQSNLSEAVILSTCLRTEVYAVVERFHDGVAELQEFLVTISGSPVDSLAEYLTVRFDDDVTTHLFTVAAGLDSAVLGESEVLGQVRRAWEKAQREQVSGPVLGALFRHSIETGKRVRSETAIARGITSFSHGAVALAAGRRRGGLGDARVLVVGAGEMGEGVAQALDGHGATSLVVANRTSDRTEGVVANVPGTVADRVSAASLDDLGELLGLSDVVFTSVATTHPVIDRAMLEPAVNGRGPDQPLLVIDLGVPRNVEPSAADLDGLVLLDMDVLRSAIADALSGRQDEVTAATRIVTDEVERHRRPDDLGVADDGGGGPDGRVRATAGKALRALGCAVGAGRRGDPGHDGQAPPPADHGPEGRGGDPEGRAPGRGASNALRPLSRAVPVVTAVPS